MASNDSGSATKASISRAATSWPRPRSLSTCCFCWTLSSTWPTPTTFCHGCGRSGSYLLLHIPLDLSAASVLRETPLLAQRRGVGHIHYFTRGLALELLSECGYEILETSYTGAHLRQRRGLGGRLASMVRRVVFALNRDMGVRLLGGDTLLVLARPRESAH